MTGDDLDPDTVVAVELAQSIHPMLAGQPAPIIAAALADLVSLMIAGHYVDGSAVQTRKLREELLDEHVKVVKRMIPLQEALLKSRIERGEIVRPS
jgi:hypothetical protein